MKKSYFLETLFLFIGLLLIVFSEHMGSVQEIRKTYLFIFFSYLSVKMMFIVLKKFKRKNNTGGQGDKETKE